MSESQRLALANTILAQLNHNTDTLNRLTATEAFAKMSADERHNALLQLRVSAEVLWRVADLTRVEAQTAQSAAAEARGGAAAT